MRVRAVVLPLVVLLAVLSARVLSGCGSRPPAAARAGCGLARPAAVTALAGAPATARLQGSLAGLTGRGEPLRCTTRGPARSVEIRAVRHPDPMRYPRHDCAEGWVYAGTPEHYAPACQVARGQGGTTYLLDRAGDYVITVAVRRPDQHWAGDAEEALVVADQVAARLR